MDFLIKLTQVLFFVGACGAGIVVIFVIRDYARVLLAKDTPSEIRDSKSTT